MNWKAYWSSYPQRFGRTDYLRQVKNTIAGEPVPDAAIQASIEKICNRLELNDRDVLLDLCCGNGVVTVAFARRCKRVVGVDFSPALLDVANADHHPPNVSYVCADVRDLREVRARTAEPFTKAVVIGALQYLDERDFSGFVQGTMRLLSTDGCLIFAGVPDRDKRWRFYNTLPRRMRYLWERVSGRDQMGTWWTRAFIERVCALHGLQCEIFDDDAQSSGYRFDVRIARSPLGTSGGGVHRGGREAAGSDQDG